MDLSPVALAWLAGFIDGEGSIGLHREFDKRRNRHTFRPCIQVCNTSREAMELVAAMIPEGSGVVTADRRATHYKPMYHFALRRSQAVLELLQQLRPYLVVKRRQADMLIAYLETRAGQGARRGRRRPYSSVDTYWYEELRAANRRGVKVAA